jgi:hypothetical protein
MLQGNDPGMVIGITVYVIVHQNCDTQGCQHTWTKRRSYGTLYNPYRHLHSIKRPCILSTRRIYAFLKTIILKSDYFTKRNQPIVVVVGTKHCL